MPRRARNQKTLSVHEALQEVRDCHSTLRHINVMDKSQSQKIQRAIKILDEVQESTKRYHYKMFLEDLLKHDDDAGPVLVMLCAIALGQAKIAHMNRATRYALLSQIKDLSQEFDRPILRSLASREGLFSKISTLLLSMMKKSLTLQIRVSHMKLLTSYLRYSTIAKWNKRK
ncbi:hypothetical protein PENANT_c145G04848 [Penicillium antarcticum]|uniref:Uncharacterized protein n=1 Tax=Penicillium antarcticum TaxID=416450 RepID=A0A1V6PFK2_9EURO|nr:hypothetical protein PENANT_c145G04848 [Penicillium antarcticum]